MLDQLTMEWTKLDNKVRFVKEIISGDLVVQNKKKKDLMSELKKRGYATMKNQKIEEKIGEIDEEDEEEEVGGYDYLLGMAIWSLTWEKVQQLIKERDVKAEEVKYLTSQSPKDLWRVDLEQLLIQWDVGVTVFIFSWLTFQAIWNGDGRAR